MLPLEGITVVTLEHAIAAPFCTRQLADLGARVIKVERPVSGDFARAYDSRVKGLASHFVWTNRSKESLTLDLKHADAGEVVGRLLARADVLVQNLAPGRGGAMGLSFEALHETYPRLVVCDISGYGDDPERTRPVPRQEGVRPADPERVRVPVDHRNARRAGQGGLLDRRHRRRHVRVQRHPLGADRARPHRQGQAGRRLDAREHGRVDELPALLRVRRRGAAAARRRRPRDDLSVRPFPAGDGKTVMLGLQNEREWVAFCRFVLEQPALATDPRFVSNAARTAAREALRAIIVEVFATLSAEQVEARLDAAQIANARVNTMADVWAHPQLAARRRWVDVATPSGPVPALLPPAAHDGDDARMDAVPALGAHTEALLAEIGLDAAAVERLRRDGAI
jgi:itaconate CoA-transferase